jgi:Flp pilus assembly pilin Flp
MSALIRRKSTLTRVVARIRREDAGMTTVEYAVGTVATASFAGLLIKLLMSEEARNLIWSVITNAISALFGG